jgi:hypothetical protein
VRVTVVRILAVSLILCMPVSVIGLRADGQSEPPSSMPRQPLLGALAQGIYIQGGVLGIVQPAGVANHRVSPAIGGHTLGVAVATGAFVTPRLAVEGEWVLARTISTPQRFSYFWTDDYIGQSRDLLVSASLRWRPYLNRRLELIGGGGLAINTYAERSIVHTDPFTGKSTAPDQSDTSLHLTLGGGLATEVPISRTTALVPSFSLRWVRRGDAGAYAGVGSIVFNLAAVLRVKF